MQTQSQLYPLLTARGFRVCRDQPDALAGIKPNELDRVLTTAERKRLSNWGAGGLTVGPNGLYLHDLERFLEWLPNDD